MPNQLNLSEKQRKCLNEARDLMNAVIRELPAERERIVGVAQGRQWETADQLASNIAANHFQSCMIKSEARPAAKR